MRNPFFYGGTASGESFCNRVVELRDLKATVDNSSNMFLFGERRLGKTSLLQKLISTLPKDDYISVYIDLWACNTEESIVKMCALAFTTLLEKDTSRLLQKAKELFSSLTPAITLDAEGNPSLTFTAVAYRKDDPLLEQVLALPQIIAEKYPEKQVVVIFDEFQQIRTLETDRVERVLRSSIQNHNMVSYIFCGSKKHLINDMFVNKKSPLFRSASHYPIDVITLDHWLKFIEYQFTVTKRAIDKKTISEVVRLTQGHPFYTQLLCSVLWEFVDGGETVAFEMVDKAVGILLNREQYAYMTLWNTLSLNVKRMVTAIAKEDALRTPYASEVIQKYGIATASTAQKALEKLKDEEIVDVDDNGIYYITDRFFSLWISQKIQP